MQRSGVKSQMIGEIARASRKQNAGAQRTALNVAPRAPWGPLNPRAHPSSVVQNSENGIDHLIYLVVLTQAFPQDVGNKAWRMKIAMRSFDVYSANAQPVELKRATLIRGTLARTRHVAPIGRLRKLAAEGSRSPRLTDFRAQMAEAAPASEHESLRSPWPLIGESVYAPTAG